MTPPTGGGANKKCSWFPLSLRDEFRRNDPALIIRELALNKCGTSNPRSPAEKQVSTHRGQAPRHKAEDGIKGRKKPCVFLGAFVSSA